MRTEVSVKERYFEPLADRLGVSDGPGGGRKVLGIQAARNLTTILAKCAEDFGSIARRLSENLG